MAIQTTANTAHLASRAAQVGFPQSLGVPSEFRRTESPRDPNQELPRVDRSGPETPESPQDPAVQRASEEVAEPRMQRTDTVRRDEVGRRQTGSRAQVTAASTTQSESLERVASGAPEPEAGQESAPSGARNLRLALGDNSRELQTRFSLGQGAQDAGQPQGPDARRTVMLRNMQSLVNTQLAQYTGNEPYSRSNYRQILGALTVMQGGGAPKAQETTSSDPLRGAWEGAEGEGDGGGLFRLYSGQAAKVLELLSPPQARPPGQEAFELVA